MSTATPAFREREFYLAEFRRRSIGIAWPAGEAPEPAALSEVIAALTANQTRVVVLSPSEAVLESAGGVAIIDQSAPDFAPKLWRSLQRGGSAGLRVSEASFETDCRNAVLELRLAKLVWVQSSPPIEREGGASSSARVSMVDLAHLAALLDEDAGPDGSGFRASRGRRAMLEAIRGMIEGGVPGVNVCAGKQLAEELFTYAGAGTFFTRNRYADVRSLSLDDFETASDLIVRGEADGFLVPRDPTSRDAVLAHAVGVFIEGRYLAGIGAILPHPGENAGEIASLYALTRYAGEGVGSQIVRHAIERASEEGLSYLFSCTTSERVVQFFERHGFRIVEHGEIPAAKWDGYDSERRERVRCLRFDSSARAESPES